MKPAAFFSLVLAAASNVLGDPTIPELPTLVQRQAVQMRESERAKPGAVTPQGCFTSDGNMKKYPINPDNPAILVSVGGCQDRCKAENATVFAVHMNDCLCGDNYPYEDDLVGNEVCNYPCLQFDQEACGGERPPAWGVYNLGFIDVDYLQPDTSRTSSTAAPSATSDSTRSTSAPVITETSAPSDGSNSGSEEDDDSGPNVVAIAAGVVGGVVIVAAVAAGFWLYIRRKRNAEIEEEHRRNAAVNAFISGSKPPSSSGLSISDSRLEPSLAHHRLSDGSIADNQDYSRKILRVINA